jgi:sigma-B regulation protein RsbU (phosphoserine phosphatase)
MRILIAEDDATSRLLLERTLLQWDYEVITTKNGTEAWEILQGEQPPNLAIFDWMMPDIDGVEVCRRARALDTLSHLYVIMLTTRDTKEDLAEALDAGADDFSSKPFNRKELQARINVGARMLNLQMTLSKRVIELEESIQREKQLQGLLPICSYCKKIRDDNNYWSQVERYIEQKADVAFSHSICPDCYESVVKPEIQALQDSVNANKKE